MAEQQFGGVARGPLVEQDPPQRSPRIRGPNNSLLPAAVRLQHELAELDDVALQEQLTALERELADPSQGVRRGLDHDLSARHRALSLEAQRREMLRDQQDRMEIHAGQRGARGLPDLALLGATDDSRRRTVRDLVEVDHRLAEDLMLELQEELGGTERVVTVTKLPKGAANAD